MQLAIFDDDANRAALSTNIFVSKELSLLFSKRTCMEATNSAEKTCLGIIVLPSPLMCAEQIP